MLTIHDRFGEPLGWGGVGEGKELKSCVGSWEQLCKQSGVVADAVLAVVVAVWRSFSCSERQPLSGANASSASGGSTSAYRNLFESGLK